MKISQKTKDIIFYVLAGLFIVAALVCGILEAIQGKTLPSWASALLCMSTVVFAVAGTLLMANQLNKRDDAKAKKDNK